MPQLSPLTSHFSPPPSAWLHNPSLSLWLSVDPMADKYPGLSPYTYCADNPVKLVDPDGRDIWDINVETGKVTRKSDNSKDEIRIVNNEGSVIKDAEGKEQSLTYEYRTIEHYTTKKHGYDVFRVRGDQKGTEIFELMANNTNVEWSQYKTGIAGTQGLNFITTGHSIDSEPAGSNLYYKQLQYMYFIREVIHNHPSGFPVPSGMPGTVQEGTGDISFAVVIDNNSKKYGYKKPTYKIYAKGYGYNEYNAESQVANFEDIYNRFGGRRPAMK